MGSATPNRDGYACPVNIPLQVICAVDTSGRISPLRFRFENTEHMIESIDVESIITRDELNYVGIREKRFVCTATLDGLRRVLELRYDVDSQRWRLYQFLS